jgi:uncharacterized delta-60 repeat protein
MEEEMKNVRAHFYERIIALSLFTACLAAFFTPAYAKTQEGKELLQFTSGSHVVGFRDSSMYLASSTHMLKVDFMGGKSVAPVSKEGPSIDGHVKPLARVTYPQVWDGVEIIYEKGKDSIIKSTFTVSTGREPASIRLHYNRPLEIDKDGNLVITYDTGSLTESKPLAWQVIEGRKRPVMVAYNLHSEKELGFTVGDYDRSIPLVIDPSLTWNTFIGGGGNDQGWAMTADSSGNVYITGYSNASWGSPIRAYTSGWDCFVAKLTADGTLAWNTFLGGSGNYEYGQSIAVDSSGNVYVTGGGDVTWGSPVRAYTAGWDCFVAKLTTDGTLIWNTFLGDSLDEGGRAIAVDTSGNVYVTGYSEATWGSPIRAYTAGDDCFVAKLATDGTLIWNTFLGGGSIDSGWGIAVDVSGNVYVSGESGETWGSPIRAYTAGDDAFVAKIASNGTLTWNTFLGGTGSDYGFGITLGPSGDLYIVGQSYAPWGSPIRPYEALDDAFVARLRSDGTLTWNTFLGGSGSDYGFAITADSNEGVYVAGQSDATWGSPFRPYTENYDAFVAKIASDGTLTWNTFLGGSSSDSGYAIATDPSGGVYLAGVSWDTWGSPIRAYAATADTFIAYVVHCTYTATPGSKSFTDKPGEVTVTVEARGGKNCANPVVSASDTWISPSLVSFGQNRGEVKMTVSRNGTVMERTGTVTIGDRTFTVTQAGVGAIRPPIGLPR